MEKKGKEKKERKPLDKRKMAQSVIIVVLIAAMVLSVAASLIYAILMQ